MTPCQDVPMVTIWVHGTRLVPKPILPKFFYAPPGLHPIKQLAYDHQFYKIARVLNAKDPYKYPLEHYYSFGWSGSLSHSSRLHASYQLYQAINKLIDHYREKFNKKPHIRIITHSHGGNVALLAGAHQPALSIDQLILLACPVQEKTQHLIKASCFKSILALYSTADMIQIIDPQILEGSSSFFSTRKFSACPHLKQACVAYPYRGLLHIEFLLEDFFKFLPAISYALEQQTHYQHCYTLKLQK